MTEDIRPARDADRDAVVALARDSFAAQRSPEEWARVLWEDADRGPEHYWVAEDAGVVVGACYLVPFRQWVRGAPLRCAGVGGVTVALTHRRRGIAGRLLKVALAAARDSGTHASALFPFRAGFYQRLGYGLAGEVDQVIVPPAAFPRMDGAPGVVAVRSAEDRDRLAAFHAEWLRGQNGQIERTAASWDRVFEPNGVGAVRVPGSGAGDTAGYAVFRPITDGGPEDRRLEIVEWAWQDARARDALLNWLGTVGDQWRKVAVRALSEERIVDRLREARSDRTPHPGWELWYGAASRMRGPMFGIVNVPAVLEQVAFAGDLAFRLDVRDDVLPGNAGVWPVRIREGRAVIEEADASGGPRLALGVSVLARLVVGDLLPSEAVRIGGAEIDDSASLHALDAVFRTSSPWTFERF